MAIAAVAMEPAQLARPFAIISRGPTWNGFMAAFGMPKMSRVTSDMTQTMKLRETEEEGIVRHSINRCDVSFQVSCERLHIRLRQLIVHCLIELTTRTRREHEIFYVPDSCATSMECVGPRSPPSFSAAR